MTLTHHCFPGMRLSNFIIKCRRSNASVGKQSSSFAWMIMFQMARQKSSCWRVLKQLQLQLLAVDGEQLMSECTCSTVPLRSVPFLVTYKYILICLQQHILSDKCHAYSFVISIQVSRASISTYRNYSKQPYLKTEKTPLYIDFVPSSIYKPGVYPRGIHIGMPLVLLRNNLIAMQFSITSRPFEQKYFMYSMYYIET